MSHYLCHLFFQLHNTTVFKYIFVACRSVEIQSIFKNNFFKIQLPRKNYRKLRLIYEFYTEEHMLKTPHLNADIFTFSIIKIKMTKKSRTFFKVFLKNEEKKALFIVLK